VSISRDRKHEAPEILQISHLFACKNKRIMLKSNTDEPLVALSKLNFDEKIILLFAGYDHDHNASFKCENAIVHCNQWVTFSLFFKRLEFPMDFIIMDRVDQWDLKRKKKDIGRIRTPIIARMNKKRLQGTNIIFTIMGDDVGLEEQMDEVITI